MSLYSCRQAWRYGGLLVLLLLVFRSDGLAQQPVSLTVTPSSVTLSANAGTTAPFSAVVSVTTTGSTFVSAVAATSSGGSWLSVSPSGAAAPETITITANPSGLQAGTYSGTIILTCIGANICAAVAIPVTFNSRGLTVSPATGISLTDFAGDANPQTAVATLTNTGSASTTYTVSVTANSQWLTVSPSSGSIAPNQSVALQITASAAKLPNSPPAATVTIAGANGLVSTLTVSLQITAPPQLSVTPNPVALASYPLDPVPVTSTATLTNTGGTATNFSIAISAGAPWLTVCSMEFYYSPCVSSGAIAAGQSLNLRIIATAAALKQGTYDATVTISSNPTGGSALIRKETAGSSGSGTSFGVKNLVSGTYISLTPSSTAVAIPPGSMRYFPKQFTVTALGQPLPSGLLLQTTSPNTPWFVLDTAVASDGSFGFTIDATHQAASTNNLGAALEVECGSPCSQPTATIYAAITASAPTLSVSGSLSSCYATAGQVSPCQSLAISSPNGALLTFASHGPSWLQVSPSVGTASISSTPLQISVDAAQLSASSPNPKTDQLVFSCTGQTTCPNVTIPVSVSVAPATVNQIASHLADGNGWKTELVLVNNDKTSASYSVNFVMDDGGPSPTITIGGQVQRPPYSGTIGVGGSQTLQTDGSPSQTRSGWAQISSMQGVSGLAIFQSSLQPQLQEAAVPLQYYGRPKMFFPYDNTTGSVTGVAVAAPGSSQMQSVAALQSPSVGQTSTSDAPQPVAANGHNDWILPADYQQGTAEIDSPGIPPLYGLGIRFNNYRFTSIEGVSPAPASTKIVAQVVDGGSASDRTTFLLVNTDTSTASFTIKFWGNDGTAWTVPLADGTSASSITGSIPFGGSQVIQTLGAQTLGNSGAANEGWAEVIGSQSLGGTAIFSDQLSGQEAAVPFQPRGGTSMVLPFDNGVGQPFGVALANVSPSSVTVTETIRDETGTIQISQRQISLPAQGHTSFILGANLAGGIPTSVARGVVEYDSTDPTIEIYAVGIRFNAGAYTTVRALNLLQ
jgi:Viral BACON domain